MVPCKYFISWFLVLWVLYLYSQFGSTISSAHSNLLFFYLGTLVVIVRMDGKARTVR